jgi:hypothetical protein
MRWCPSCYLRQQCPEAGYQPLKLMEGSAQAHAKRFRQLRVGLLERQRLGNHANLLAAEWIEPFPKPPLAASISPQPFLAGSGRATCFRFGDGW